MENNIPPQTEASPTVIDNSQIQEQSPAQRPSLSALILSGLTMLILGVSVGYYLGSQTKTTQSSPVSTTSVPSMPVAQDETVATTEPAMIPEASETSDWMTFVSQANAFSVQYPRTVSGYDGEWQYKEAILTDGTAWIGFRPSSVTEDHLWVIMVSKSDDLERLISEQGSQFQDRKVDRQNITVNGAKAILVTVTTDSIPNWVYKTVYVQDGEKLYVISNGAVDLVEFEEFYNSFKVI